MRDYIRDVVKKLIDAGCEYIHMDAPNYAQWHTDPKIRAAFESWGHDMDTELIEDAEIDNSVFDGITGITRAIHLCRGNAPRGRWLANGGYEAIAERFYPLLTNYDTLLLEYDSPRAGDFSSLKHVRPDTDRRARIGHDQGRQARRSGAGRGAHPRGREVRSAGAAGAVARNAALLPANMPTP